jgi:hypothetical protein
LLVTVIEPLRAPAAAGVNCTLTVHDEPTFTVAPSVQVRLTIGNSVGLLLATVVICAAAVPVLVIVLATIELDAPTLTVPKFCADGIVSAGVPAPAVCPVPLTANDCGLPTPLLTMLIWPLRVPVAAGVNWIFTVHEESGFTNAPAVQVPPTIANSRGLLLVTDVSWTAALPMLDTVFVTTLLPTPTVTVPKFAAVGIESWLVTPPPNVCR